MSDFPYLPTYDPAIPACGVTLTARPTGRSQRMTAIVDTGADASLVPEDTLREIGARRAFEARLRSQWGERRQVFLYLVDVQIADLTLPGVYVVGDDRGQECVLGRNVLNRLRILLDGPAALTQILR